MGVAATSAPGCAAPRPGRPRTSRRSSACPGPGRFRAAYLVAHDAAAAEDIAQEAFLAAIRSLDRFDRRRPFGPWLHRIVVNRAIDWTRALAAPRRERARRPAPAPERGDAEGLLGALARLPRSTGR